MSAPSPLSPPARRLRMSALTEPVEQSALRAFISDSKATGKPWRHITTGLPRPGVGDIIGQLIPVIIPLAGLLFLLYAGGSSLLKAVWGFTLEAPFPLNLVIVGVLAMILLSVAWAALRVIKLIRSLVIPRWCWEAAYRITRFAAANNLRYGHDEVVSYSGLIFGAGIDRTAERRLTTTAGRRVEIGNYRYTIRAENQENSKVYGWGYVAITLDRRLPHLLLDAKANDSSAFGIRTSNLPVDLARDQRLSLGGEFDDKFTLYAPSDYGRDAFYVFAPDLMALFIDRLGTFDVEIIDDTMFVYGSRFELLDPRTYEWLEELVDTVVSRTVRRTERYRDDLALLETEPARRQSGGEAAAAAEDAPGQSGDGSVFRSGGDGPPRTATNTIAGKGRRLRRSRWGVGSVVGLLVIGYWIYNEFIAPIFGLPTLGR
ncbi:MAG: hypothetical protein JWN06_3571 [Propionibacteriaceae bacterium]|nr:hypothetical protein [Propionibacteriaceae bacterium]